VTARYTHLLRAARWQVLHLAMPPYVADSSEVPDRLDAQAAVIRKGVRFRSVYDADTFDDALSSMTARRGDEIGGEIRLSSGLPMKLVMFDDTAAIMPLRSDDPAAGSLLVHSPTLLYVLSVLFEELWEHGVPWKSDGTGAAAPAEPTEPAPDARGMEVLRLMCLGMKDDVIARVLGVSRRTVQQDISDIGALLGARTRFQIAIFAQQRGWLPEVTGRKEPQRGRLSPDPAVGDRLNSLTRCVTTHRVLIILSDGHIVSQSCDPPGSRQQAHAPRGEAESGCGSSERSLGVVIIGKTAA
jgi:DNA-binding CsgD family transcriptional regulator